MQRRRFYALLVKDGNHAQCQGVIRNSRDLQEFIFIDRA